MGTLDWRARGLLLVRTHVAKALAALHLTRSVSVVLRGVLVLALFCVACSGQAARSEPPQLETTAIARAALSCVTQSSVSTLPQWTVGNTYQLDERIQFQGQPFACAQPVCVAQAGWEPGSPGLTAVWKGAPLCGIQNWAVGVAYDAGAIVSSNGQLYVSLVPHTSQPDWPPGTPTVWQPFDPSAGGPGASGDVTQVTPTVACVSQTSPGQFTAVFGYKNQSGQTVIAPIGASNQFAGSPAGRGQPISFAAGEHDAAFVVDFDGKALTWTLGGQSVTASSANRGCPTNDGPNGPIVSIGGRSSFIPIRA